MICPNCGRVFDGRFCAYCGADADFDVPVKEEADDNTDSIARDDLTRELTYVESKTQKIKRKAVKALLIIGAVLWLILAIGALMSVEELSSLASVGYYICLTTAYIMIAFRRDVSKKTFLTLVFAAATVSFAVSWMPTVFSFNDYADKAFWFFDIIRAFFSCPAWICAVMFVKKIKETHIGFMTLVSFALIGFTSYYISYFNYAAYGYQLEFIKDDITVASVFMVLFGLLVAAPFLLYPVLTKPVSIMKRK